MRIVTDSASDILFDEAIELDIDVVDIEITFEDGPHPQKELIDFEKFYERLEKADLLPTTSQPSPKSYLEIFEKAKEIQEEVLVITLSKGLSGTYNCAMMVRDMFDDNEFIHVFDSAQAVLSQRLLVNKAVELRDQGQSVSEIIAQLKELNSRIRIYAGIDTLLYLKKGGRVPSSIATIGNLLKIKPILVMKEGVLHSHSQARGKKSMKQTLLNLVNETEVDENYPILIGYTGNQQDKEVAQEFMSNLHQENTILYPVGGVIGCHLGPRGLLVCFVEKV